MSESYKLTKKMSESYKICIIFKHKMDVFLRIQQHEYVTQCSRQCNVTSISMRFVG